MLFIQSYLEWGEKKKENAFDTLLTLSGCVEVNKQNYKNS